VITPNPAIVTQTATQRLPRWVLVGMCLIYVFTGLIHRDPWKSLDVSSFGYMWEIAQGRSHLFDLQMAQLPPELQGPLPYALGSAAIFLLDQWMTPDAAAKIPFIIALLGVLIASWYAFYFNAKNPFAQPVAFAFGGEAKPEAYAKALADAGLMALIACLGLALPSHETTPTALQLFFTALLFCGASLIRVQISLAVIVCNFSLITLTLSGAPFVATILGMGIIFIAINESKLKTKYLLLLIGGLVAAIGTATWANLWQWCVLSFDQAAVQWKGLLRLLIWFTWPVWPLAAWTLWTWRHQWKNHIWHQHLFIPTYFTFVILVASVSTINPERTLLLSIPSLACLATFALPTLKRSFSALIDWFTLLFFSGGAIIIWVVWLSLQTGWPTQPAINVSRLIPGYTSEFNWIQTISAMLMTAIWVRLVLWRLSRHPRFIWKSLVLPASGALLCWVLLMSLWMPMLNYARSYKPLAIQVNALTGSTQCLYSLGMSRAQIAGVGFHGGYLIKDFGKNLKNHQCDWLIANPDSLTPKELNVDLNDWQKIKTIRRPADKREDIVIFKRLLPTQE
jgi:4-amino-4-deoxy-L-arabinose transferase-like glycosyltransferase